VKPDRVRQPPSQGTETYEVTGVLLSRNPASEPHRALVSGGDVRCGRVYPTGHPCNYRLAKVAKYPWAASGYCQFEMGWRVRASDGVLLFPPSALRRLRSGHAPTRRPVGVAGDKYGTTPARLPLDGLNNVIVQCPACHLVQVCSVD
jgi:hypothetical protein